MNKYPLYTTLQNNLRARYAAWDVLSFDTSIEKIAWKLQFPKIYIKKIYI